MFNLFEYIIILLITTVLCVVAVTYLSAREEQHDSGDVPLDVSVLETDNVDKQSKSNRKSLRKISVAFTFEVTCK